MESFFANTKVAHTFSLVDIRHDPTQDDYQMINYLYHFHLPFTLIAKKADKLGKSKVKPQAKYLSQKLNITLINKDIIKEILGDNIYASNREENLKLSVISFELIEYFLRSSKDNLIIESNFKQHEIDRLAKYCNEINFLKLLFI